MKRPSNLTLTKCFFLASSCLIAAGIPSALKAQTPVVANPTAPVVANPTAPAVANPTAPAVPSAGAGGAPAPGPALAGKLGEAKIAIVAGNVASARERALAEAFKRAVDTAIADLAPDVRTTQAKTVLQVLGRARTFVRRYRTLEEGELSPGSYTVRLDAEIDEPALRRAFDRPAPIAPGPTAASGYLIVGSGNPEAALAISKAMGSGGAKIRLGTPSDAETPARAIESAAKAQLAAVAFVTASAQSEGRVRGPGVESVSCSIALRIVAVGSGLPQADESESGRSFAEREDLARRDCFARTSTAVVARTVLVSSEGRSTADLRTVLLDADVSEPGAVIAILKQLRGLGSVSSVDVRRIAVSHAELRVRSRLPGSALIAVLVRDSVGIEWLAPEVTGDLIRARVRLKPVESDRAVPENTTPAPGTSTTGVTNSPPSGRTP